MSTLKNTHHKQPDEIITTRRKQIFSIRNLLLFLISVGLLYFLLSKIDFNKTITTFKQANYGMLFLAAILYCCSNLFKTFRFKVILHSTNSSFKINMFKLYTIVSFHNFFNQILPARTGELTFIYYLKKIGKIDISKGVHSLLIARIFDLIIVSTFFVVSVLMYFGKKSSLNLIVIGIISGIVSLLILLYVDKLIMIFRSLFRSMITKFNIKEKKIISKINDKFDLIIDEFHQFDTAKNIPKLAITSIMVWAALYSIWYVSIRAFNVSITVLQNIVGSTGAVLTNLLPINSFGSLGTFEIGWVGGFVWIGMDKQDAITTGFGNHFVLIIAGAIISLICYVILRLKNSSK